MDGDPRDSVVDADCRSWDVRNLWVCDGSVFPTVGGVNPSLTTQAIACRTGDRIKAVARPGAASCRRPNPVGGGGGIVTIAPSALAVR